MPYELSRIYWTTIVLLGDLICLKNAGLLFRRWSFGCTKEYGIFIVYCALVWIRTCGQMPNDCTGKFIERQILCTTGASKFGLTLSAAVDSILPYRAGDGFYIPTWGLNYLFHYLHGFYWKNLFQIHLKFIMFLLHFLVLPMAMVSIYYSLTRQTK